MRHAYQAVFALVAVSMAGCVSTSRVLELGPDTYSVSSTADGVRTAASARQSAFETGSDKCSSIGKRFMLMNESAAPTLRPSPTLPILPAPPAVTFSAFRVAIGPVQRAGVRLLALRRRDLAVLAVGAGWGASCHCNSSTWTDPPAPSVCKTANLTASSAEAPAWSAPIINVQHAPMAKNGSNNS